MSMSLDSFAVLSLVGIAQAALLAGALVTLRRGEISANRMLAAFLTTVSINIGGINYVSRLDDTAPRTRIL